ncbi:MAG: YraN family protein, partial [Phycisphaerales bacterium]
EYNHGERKNGLIQWNQKTRWIRCVCWALLLDWVRGSMTGDRRASANDAEHHPSWKDLTLAEIGRHGEHLASVHLVEGGLRIVARNRRIAGVEIDLVAADDARHEWVVIEVKTTTTGTPGERRVDRGRLRRLERAAITLGHDRPARIMIVAVDLRCRPPEILVFEE